MIGTIVAVAARQDSPSFGLRDQIIRNTQRLDSLERSLDNLQNGGSNTANILAIKVGVLESKLDSTRNEMEDLRRIVYGALGLVLMQALALAIFGFKSWFSWINKQARPNE